MTGAGRRPYSGTMAARWALAQGGEVRSAIERGLPEGVWPALGVLLLCLLLIAVVMRVRSLRREARARRQARESRVGGGAAEDRPPTRAPAVDPDHPSAVADSPRAGRPDPPIRPPADTGGPVPAGGSDGRAEVRGPVRVAGNGKPTVPAPAAGAGPARVEAALFDAEGNRTRHPRQAVRGEMVGYDADGREVGRAALELPRREPAPHPAPSLTTRRRRVPPPAANGGNGRPTTRRRRKVASAADPPANEEARGDGAN